MKSKNKYKTLFNSQHLTISVHVNSKKQIIKEASKLILGLALINGVVLLWHLK
ncbi:hypothetical protein [Fructilactobacillus fructivorans]|uniref:hypothetical protein n=1 Tax=Fructilactobacillus fructivorans TaxID=1614 RepID=UPI0002196C94|nr:hypothetical protein [Fructilactobacillus fructivorans]KRK58079.1 hypothetical protein FC73_GL000457 [Fructilactobacillus fructivorans]KRN13099.1 hypothetical protein IV37_GL000737 [Fructilactobacillus fructivorans]KRN41308.1 hypothetical protein IV51_GL000628 [Fructilactobacillus fructivorans]KRN42894.1 hypothetical protein IV48_GL001122 [Fructilactobacillus fructivorans]